MGAMLGYYDENGRWVAGAAVGHYDAYGRWIPGTAAGHRAPDGTWVADAQPGYYDVNGQWHAGSVYGYYDERGRWSASALSVGAYGADSTYETRARWGAATDLRSRETWLDQRIRSAAASGKLTRYDASRALRTLGAIRRQDVTLSRRHRGLTQIDTASLQGKLDNLRTQVRASLDDANRCSD